MEKDEFRSARRKIRVDNEILFCDYHGKDLQQIAVEDIFIIGLHANWDGPCFQYSYIDFVTNDGQWEWFPLDAENSNELIDFLQERFQIDFKNMLVASSNEWSSVVVYPKDLQGNPYFKFIPTEDFKEPKTKFDKLLSNVGLGNFNTVRSIDLSDEVRAKIKKTNR
ncbi:MAG: hypothetical protein EOP48_15205 [Sphingobacteriales bacterium]|nr:MAG: hypothetical protein EOP48_15205 [Sphingobacteriales bacterium]